MGEIIEAIKSSPVPTMLIIAGLFFLLLGFVSKIGGIIEVSPEQRIFAIPTGLFVLILGLVLNFSSVFEPTDLDFKVTALDHSSFKADIEGKFFFFETNEMDKLLNDKDWDGRIITVKDDSGVDRDVKIWCREPNESECGKTGHGRREPSGDAQSDDWEEGEVLTVIPNS